MELLAAVGAGCPGKCNSTGYSHICGHAADFGAAVYLAGCDADGSATARCGATALAGGAFFCSGDQPVVFLFALRDGIALGDGATRSNAVAGDPHAGSLDSAERGRSRSDGDRSHDCDWFHVYRAGDGGASVLRLGIVCSVAVLPRAVFGAGVQLPRATVVWQLHECRARAHRVAWRSADVGGD